jgi:hypothetical protein
MPCLRKCTVTDYKGAQVYTLEGKKIGRIKDVDSGYFTAFRRGILTDEKFRIPMSAISTVEKVGSSTIVRLSLKEEQVKHGYEFAKGRPNSEFIGGSLASEPKIPAERQVIRYESIHTEEESRIERPPAISEYVCDMCDEKFDSPQKLQEHRGMQHKAPTGI